MSRLLLINRRPEQRRVALIENGITTELFFERLESQSLIGNIYKGRVVRVLPGIQAAFVEIGLQRTGFLFVGDVVNKGHDEHDHEALLGEAGVLEDEDEDDASNQGKGSYPPIASLLVQGQTLLVQVTKMPLGKKGARLSTHISLPGRHLVYTPTSDHIGISRRIRSPEERRRLRALGDMLRPEEGGLIVRTASEGLDEDAFRDDISFLTALWKDIQERARMTEPPSLIHEDLDLTLRSLRDLIVDQDDRVVVDHPQELQRISNFMGHFMPGFENKVQKWDSPEPMFERYGVEWEITRASRRKIWLKSGGYILIDRTEALTAVDVNTGRYVGSSNFEDTVYAINLEAVKEIAYQLRLRDIGGLIVIDFIDMAMEKNQDKVVEALKLELKRDRAPTKVLAISDLGLLEMTRKRVRNSIVAALTEPCFYCEGKGYLRSMQVICDAILFSLHQQVRGRDGVTVEICANPRVMDTLIHEWQGELKQVEELHQVILEFSDHPEMHVEWFELKFKDQLYPLRKEQVIATDVGKKKAQN